MSLKYPHLFEPLTLGRTTFRNRIFSSPQDYLNLSAENFLTHDAIAFYELKALGGFGSVCLGDVMVDSKRGMGHRFQLRADDVRARASMNAAALAISRHGAVATAELNHAGKFSHLMAEREGFTYGPVAETVAGIEVRQMPEEVIEQIIASYAAVAAFVKQSGFGMINIHGGHGWLLGQFMTPANNRKDKWGGSLENRMRFPLAVIEAVRREVGPHFPLEIRMSGAEKTPTGYDLDEGIAIARMLDGKVDLINVSMGHHEDDVASMYTHPNMFMEDGCNAKYAAAVKKAVSTPVSAVGALTDPAQMEELIASGAVDAVELGRQSLADPDLPIKARQGKDEEINRCMRCYNCFHNSTISGIFYCATNPVIGHEYESLFDTPPRKRKKVLIAGGGIGGMQAAITAAERGHQVILCEKSDSLGGVLRCEKNVPFKQKLDGYLNLQRHRIAGLENVQVRLNTPVTPALARQIGPDVIIAAMGSQPVRPPVPGIDGGNVIGAQEAYVNTEKVGQNAVIMGGGLVGVELGIYLAGLGRNVTVVEMAGGIAGGQDPADVGESAASRINSLNIFHGDNIVHTIALNMQIDAMDNLNVLLKTRAVEITPEGMVVENAAGRQLLRADTVIYAAGQRPLKEESLALNDCAPEFYAIGDCVTPKNIFAATQSAYQIAKDIGRY
jgi:2,4-dienoyl-CoA reductase-like NADH-dependent reductase (Old Yellow Enzyme family)/thioredoxin reductase